MVGFISSLLITGLTLTIWSWLKLLFKVDSKNLEFDLSPTPTEEKKDSSDDAVALEFTPSDDMPTPSPKGQSVLLTAISSQNKVNPSANLRPRPKLKLCNGSEAGIVVVNSWEEKDENALEHHQFIRRRYVSRNSQLMKRAVTVEEVHNQIIALRQELQAIHCEVGNIRNHIRLIEASKVKGF